VREKVKATIMRQRFTALLEEKTPIIIPGAYDALSARLVEASGYSAAYVGSYGTAAACYGLPDVGALTMNELADHACAVAEAVSIPVLADAEAGFFEAPNIWRTVQTYERAGVCGIHIEDNAGGKHSDAPQGLLPVDRVVNRIRAALDARSDPNFQVIARTDAIWVHNDVDEALLRIRAFVEAGADIVFPTAIAPTTLKTIRDQIPCRVLVLGDLPLSSVAEMEDAGADIVIYYAFCLLAAVRGVTQALDEMGRTLDVRLVGELLEDGETFESRMGYEDFSKRARRYGGDQL
jgi:2-methylisocitrate lyase-like PEP mutase family enzyme